MDFMNSYFKPMPQDAEQVKALLQPPKPQPVQNGLGTRLAVGGSAGSGGYSGGRIEIPSDNKYDDPNYTGGQGLLGT